MPAGRPDSSLDQFAVSLLLSPPTVAEQHIEVAVFPFRGVGLPCASLPLVVRAHPSREHGLIQPSLPSMGRLRAPPTSAGARSRALPKVCHRDEGTVSSSLCHAGVCLSPLAALCHRVGLPYARVHIDQPSARRPGNLQIAVAAERLSPARFLSP